MVQGICILMITLVIGIFVYMTVCNSEKEYMFQEADEENSAVDYQYPPYDRSLKHTILPMLDTFPV